MGNALGHVPQNGFDLYLHPEVTPSPLEEPTFDPLMGFPNGRKPREMKLTKEELESAKIPIKDRDYCSHKLLAFRTCRQDNFPFVVNCAHEKHDYLTCKYEDFIIRMKEYERERRLRVKRQALRQKQEAARKSIEA